MCMLIAIGVWMKMLGELGWHVHCMFIDEGGYGQRIRVGLSPGCKRTRL